MRAAAALLPVAPWLVANLQRSGVTVIDPATTWIDVEVSVGRDTVIHPGTQLQGSTVVVVGLGSIGRACAERLAQLGATVIQIPANQPRYTIIAPALATPSRRPGLSR